MGHVICKAMGGSNDRGALWIIMPNQKDIYIYTHIYILSLLLFFIIIIMTIITIIIIILHMYICAYIYKYMYTYIYIYKLNNTNSIFKQLYHQTRTLPTRGVLKNALAP